MEGKGSSRGGRAIIISTTRHLTYERIAARCLTVALTTILADEARGHKRLEVNSQLQAAPQV
jgi:hypothetical protein